MTKKNPKKRYLENDLINAFIKEALAWVESVNKRRGGIRNTNKWG